MSEMLLLLFICNAMNVALVLLALLYLGVALWLHKKKASSSRLAWHGDNDRDWSLYHL